MFDIAQLSEDDIGHLAFIVSGPSWNSVFRPFYERVGNMYTELLLNPNPHERTKYGGDEYLRAGANNIRKTLEFFDRILSEANTERIAQIRQSMGKLPTESDLEGMDDVQY